MAQIFFAEFDLVQTFGGHQLGIDGIGYHIFQESLLADLAVQITNDSVVTVWTRLSGDRCAFIKRH